MTPCTSMLIEVDSVLNDGGIHQPVVDISTTSDHPHIFSFVHHTDSFWLIDIFLDKYTFCILLQ